MPMLRVYTNVSIEESFKQEFLKSASKIVATELHKPESYVTVSLFPEISMIFGGSNEPCAQAYLMSLGGLNGKVNTKISSKLSSLFEKYLNVPSDRYYIHFVDCEGDFIGYEGATF